MAAGNGAAPSKTASRGNGFLLFSFMLLCCNVCKAGSAGAAARCPRRPSRSRARNSCREFATLPELRGGGQSAGSTRYLPAGVEGVHREPVDVESDGSVAAVALDVNVPGAKCAEEENEEEEATWLDRESRDTLPATAPASQLVIRSCFLLLVFLFPMLSAGLAFFSSWFRRKIWFGALTRSIGMSGTAFIKWGQWSSTRPDMFPEGLCESLAVLHKGAPSHRFAHTKKLVERAFGGRPISEVFEWFESKPMASGSIAQVHKAVLNGEMVAVKVRHPNVKERMFLDFVLMKKVADFADRRPSLKWMNLGPSMEQFSHTMSAQTDLVLEAKHLDAFNANFNGRRWSDCTFPRVIHCVEDVLVETFEEGIVVAEYAKMFSGKPAGDKNAIWEGAARLLGRRRAQRQDASEQERPDPSLGHFIVTRGEDMWLKMVLNDGLLHADLHPGNILVYAPKGGARPPRLVLVDAGMVAKLYGHQKRHFVRLLECLGSGDGIAAGRTVLQFSTKQTCLGEQEQAAFLEDMDAVFRERCKGYHKNVDVGNILRGVLTCVRQHSVRVDVEYATLILNILCLESIGKVLLPTYNLLDGAKALLEVHKVGRRLVGGFGVKTILPLARAHKWRQDRKFLRRLKHEMTAERKRRGKAATLYRTEQLFGNGDGRSGRSERQSARGAGAIESFTARTYNTALRDVMGTPPGGESQDLPGIGAIGDVPQAQAAGEEEVRSGSINAGSGGSDSSGELTNRTIR